MKATQAYRGHFLPKKCVGKRTLRECSTSGKRDNIVLIEVDSDDFGDVIILDVPESFPEKFKKNQDPDVIKIDVEDGGESDTAPCNMNVDHSTTSKYSPTSATPSSNWASADASANDVCPPASATSADDEDCLFINAGNTPVKLSKSKRTYSGTSTSRNRYGLTPDSESSSESDCSESDCELMEGSSGKLREQWEKAFSNRRRESYCHHYDEVNDADTSTAYQPFHCSNEASTPAHSDPASQQSYSSVDSHESNGQKQAGGSNFFQKDFEANQMDENYSRRYDSSGYSDFRNEGDTSTLDQPVDDGSEQNEGEHVELPNDGSCFKSCVDHDKYDSFHGCPEKSNNFQHDHDTEYIDILLKEFLSNRAAKEKPCSEFEFSSPPITCKEQGAGNNSIHCHNSEQQPSLDQNNILTDRQKIKETDEYKRAMEEEWASRQQQLQRQAEEAQRLRIKKRAEKMRIMDNERRQKQRLEEMRETMRKDEENLNLKDNLRAEIRKELHRLEIMCSDMVSLLRFLGIHVPPFPSPTEVQAAYKRACLKFHPDRLISTDLRQQVEAEEKFKLISTMKEKFLK